MESRLKSVKQVNPLSSLDDFPERFDQRATMSREGIGLSQAGQGALDTLALLAESLGMGGTDLSNYYTALSKLSMDQMDIHHESSVLEEIEYKLDECQKKANDELDLMKGILTKLQTIASENHSQYQDIAAPGQAFQEASSRCLALENKYNEMDIEMNGTTLTHVHELETKTISLEKQYEQKYKIMKTYQGLPPDMALASFKIRKTKDQLHELELERENLISDIARSVY